MLLCPIISFCLIWSAFISSFLSACVRSHHLYVQYIITEKLYTVKDHRQQIYIDYDTTEKVHRHGRQPVLVKFTHLGIKTASIVKRLDFPVHHPSSLLGCKYLNEVPVFVMCPLQPVRSDMQNGNDLLWRQKGNKANVKLCSPELGLRLWVQGWGHVGVMRRLC